MEVFTIDCWSYKGDLAVFREGGFYKDYQIEGEEDNGKGGGKEEEIVSAEESDWELLVLEVRCWNQSYTCLPHVLF